MAETDKAEEEKTQEAKETAERFSKAAEPGTHTR